MPEAAAQMPVRTTCPYCGVGCGVQATAGPDGQVEIAGDPTHPANRGRLCSKGSALGETLDLDQRLLQPRVEGRDVDWDTALDDVADRFRRVLDTHGPEAVALYVSGQLLTEDYYVANKFAKGGLGTGNIDTNSRLCMSSSVVGYQRAFGEDVVPGCYDDLDEADLIVLVGANTAWCHPIVYQRIRGNQRQRKARVVVIDPRRSATAEEADLHLPLAPGSDVALFQGLLAFLEHNGHLDYRFLEAQVSGFGEALAAAREQGGSPADVAGRCGLEAEDVARFFQLFAGTDRVVTLYSQGVNQSSAGSDKVSAVINCHLATGRLNRPGTGPFSITGQPNAMGGREVGGLSSTLAAHMGFDEFERVQRFWGSQHMARKPGLKAVDLFDAVEDGRIQLIWIMATNPVVSMPDADRVRDALRRCPHVIVSDCMANTDTVATAQVRLPAEAWGEKDGTVTNSERMISRQRRFLTPAGQARPDWWMVAQVAQRLGLKGFAYQSAAEIFDEHARLTAFENHAEGRLRQLNLAGLVGQGAAAYAAMEPRQWPVTGTASRARPFADQNYSTATGKAHMQVLRYRPPAHSPDADYPMVLNTGRVRDHWHTMTRTGKAPRLGGHRPEPTVDVHPDDARRLALFEHEVARIDSRWGQALARVHIDAGQRPGSVFVPMHWNDAVSSHCRIDAVVNPVVDPDSGEPEFKHTPVRLQSLPASWYGFVLSRQTLTPAGGGGRDQAPAYWVRARGPAFWRMEFVSIDTNLSPEDWVERAKVWLGGERGEWLHYVDARTRQGRIAHIRDGRLEGCLFVAAGPARLPDRGWLGGLFAKPALDEADRRGLLAGQSPEPGSDPGPQVCACFGVGRQAIVDAIAQGCGDTDALGRQLKAGTNCGSCLPELRMLLATES